eukprot:1552331-Prymnesium_polylepis.1
MQPVGSPDGSSTAATTPAARIVEIMLVFSSAMRTSAVSGWRAARCELINSTDATGASRESDAGRSEDRQTAHKPDSMSVRRRGRLTRLAPCRSGATPEALPSLID